jgi:hypothetical protein
MTVRRGDCWSEDNVIDEIRQTDHEESDRVLRRYEPCFSSTEPFQVQSVNDRRPEQLETERPEREGESRLLRPTSAMRLNNQRNGRGHTQWNALE